MLMSIKRASYHTLDEVATALWDAIGAGGRRADVVDAVMTRFGLSDPVIADGLRQFIDDLIGRGLIVVRESPADGATPRATIQAPPSPPASVDRAIALPSVATCALGLTVVAIALRLLGLERVWRRAHGRTSPIAAACPRDTATELTRRVGLAASVCPLRMQCLEQSVFILWWLRRAGIDGQLRFGVQQYPFMAHAWVETTGVPVNDAAERLKIYRTFPLVAFEGW